MTASNSPWRLDGSRATLACGKLSAVIDLESIQRGLQSIVWSGDSFDLHLLGPELSLPSEGHSAITETYVRGSDLVVSFERPGPLAVVPQLYWRVRQHEAMSAVAIELIVSTRTDLLDSQPRTIVVTEVGEAAAADLPPWLFRPTPQVSYCQVVHPDDFDAVECRRVGSVRRLVTTLFPERLEKGVIRRARIRGWFLPAENDLAVAVELARQFIAESPPLTT